MNNERNTIIMAEYQPEEGGENEKSQSVISEEMKWKKKK